ncbi:winged helix-turn-helix domain-containing protein [Thomasclavelia spiroformis]|jgi:DNA-binding transcriptional regulator GbsR (MarR family)|uniref:winged helix-turn-helix domain-containing protein n=1 Tax=Thomasclavelia spiroformis TaxID=29348 RepID=UPI0020454AB8|nr:winged helix-turn-helix domain-containing protein [Thomasclavelia spiroformis]DAM23938.1 MAG TPA: Transcriptional regulator, MarR/EmrR family, emrR, transcriptional regulator, DNA-binding [Caudoviricetes sp.]
MRVLTENDYKVMSKILNSKEKTGLSKTTGVTRQYLTEQTNLSYSKVGQALNALIEYGFVDLGIAKSRSKTYFLTTEGMLELKEITQNVIKIKEESDNE